MIKINWVEIKSLKTHLARLGFSKDSEVVLLVFFKGKKESQTIKLRLGKLDQLLFDIESNQKIYSIFLFDSDVKRALWKTKDTKDYPGVEYIPAGGHPQVIEDYKDMDEDSRQVWADITAITIQQYMSNLGDNDV